MKKIIFLILSICCLNAWADSTPQIELNQNLQAMTKTWNEGNVKDFVKGYKDSDDTLYISNKIIHGYQNILKRYLQSYPTKNDMGTLSFSNVIVKVLSDQYAMVIGNWNLVRPVKGNIGGIFTLLYEKTPGGWKIIVDHTS